MDETYKMWGDWYHHGELNSRVESDTKLSQCKDEVFGFYQAAQFLDEEFASKAYLSEIAKCDDKKEDEFLAKLADAETSLYPSCRLLNLYLDSHKKWLV